MSEKLKRAKKQFNNFLALTKGYGQWKTIKRWSTIDENGNPIPWYAYPKTEYLTHLNFKEFSVFKYGSGNFTLWRVQKAKSIISVKNVKDLTVNSQLKLKYGFVHITEDGPKRCY